MQWKERFTDDFILADRMLENDIASGRISRELKLKLAALNVRVDDFCRPKWYSPKKDRQAFRDLWKEYRRLVLSAKPQKPVRCYGFERLSTPDDFGITDCADNMLSALEMIR